MDCGAGLGDSADSCCFSLQSIKYSSGYALKLELLRVQYNSK